MVFVCDFLCVFAKFVQNFSNFFTKTWLKSNKTRQGVIKSSCWCFHVQFIPIWVVSKRFCDICAKFLKSHMKNTGTQSCAGANGRERLGTKILFGICFRGPFSPPPWFSVVHTLIKSEFLILPWLGMNNGEIILKYTIKTAQAKHVFCYLWCLEHCRESPKQFREDLRMIMLFRCGHLP